MQLPVVTLVLLGFAGLTLANPISQDKPWLANWVRTSKPAETVTPASGWPAYLPRILINRLDINGQTLTKLSDGQYRLVTSNPGAIDNQLYFRLSEGRNKASNYPNRPNTAEPWIYFSEEGRNLIMTSDPEYQEGGQTKTIKSRMVYEAVGNEMTYTATFDGAGIRTTYRKA